MTYKVYPRDLDPADRRTLERAAMMDRGLDSDIDKPGDHKRGASVVEQITVERGSVDAREGLDLIMLKVSRIVTGDPTHLDNWDDIGGHARIVADRLRGEKK